MMEKKLAIAPEQNNTNDHIEEKLIMSRITHRNTNNHMSTNAARIVPPTSLHMLDEHSGMEYTSISSKMLESDTSYHNGIDMDEVSRIVENFDARLVNPVNVSCRDGHFYVFDGAQTLAALKVIHNFEPFMVPCMLFHGLSNEDEAYLYSRQCGEHENLSTADQIKALTAAGELYTYQD